MFGLVGVIGGVSIVWLIGEDEVRAGLAGVAWVGAGLAGAVGMACVFGVAGIVGVF